VKILSHFIGNNNYYEVLDLVISGIMERFNQLGNQLYQQLEDLLVKSIKQKDCSECLSAVAAFYTTDFDLAQLKLHLDVLSSNFPADSRGSITVLMLENTY